MQDLILKIYDDGNNVIFEQMFYNITDKAIDAHGQKLKEFFKAKYYQTFDW